MTPGIENLPVEIVRRLLERGGDIAAKAAAQADRLSQARDELRACMAPFVSEVPDAVLDRVPRPTVAAVDGGCVCDSRSIGDICTAAAVTASGDGSESGCEVWMEIAPRAAGNKEALSALMRGMEISLAARSAAGVVMVDGSMQSALIALSKAVREAPAGPLRDRIREMMDPDFREAVLTLLKSRRHVAMPKYTTTNEFRAVDGFPGDLAGHDARTVATMALRAGEMTHLTRREEGLDDSRRRLIGPALGFTESEMKEFSSATSDFGTCYYRPHPWTPAFRIDMPASESDGEAQASALRAVRDTTSSGGLREPFPLYLVDLFAKQVSAGAAPVVDMAASAATDDPEAKFLIAAGYRS